MIPVTQTDHRASPCRLGQGLARCPSRICQPQSGTWSRILPCRPWQLKQLARLLMQSGSCSCKPASTVSSADLDHNLEGIHGFADSSWMFCLTLTSADLRSVWQNVLSTLPPYALIASCAWSVFATKRACFFFIHTICATQAYLSYT